MWQEYLQSGAAFRWAAGLYFAAAAAYALGLALKSGGFRVVPALVLIGAFAANTTAIAQRWAQFHQPPFATLHESLVLLAWCIGAVWLVAEFFGAPKIVGPFASLLALVALVFAVAKRGNDITNLPPVLRSPWFVPHVLAYFLAYAALAVSFFMGLIRIIGTDHADDLDGRMHRTIFIGFVLLTLGMLMGSVWAWQAWGDYWSWDPKEGWALVTWLIYAAYMHLRLVAGWDGRRLAWFAVAGFAAVVFTYVGMNILPSAASSLHFYQ